MVATDINIADWVEVVRAENHEISDLDSMPPIPDSMADRLSCEQLVVLLVAENLKRARYRAYIPFN
jgi:hypothetical protein